MKESIARYLLELAGKDAAFAKKFNLRKLTSCIAYVTQNAKKYLCGRNGCIEDTLIYKWAVEYYMTGNNGIAIPDTKAPEQRIKTWAEAKAELEAKKHRVKKEKAEPVSDVDAGQLLFDFMGQEEYKEWTSKML